jgi:M6 family metalloprotease-like protein
MIQQMTTPSLRRTNVAAVAAAVLLGCGGSAPSNVPDAGSGAAGSGAAGATAGLAGSSGTAGNPLSTPLLIVLTDFSDSDIASYLPNPEAKWSDLMFGRNPGQGNNYWYEVSQGQFQLIKTRETQGQADNGVIHVHVAAKKPTAGQFLVQAQPWIPDALEQAAKVVRFADYDLDKNGRISNRELSILFVLNLDFPNISGAGAEANIMINHAIGGSGPIIEKFARVEDDYTSIGTPCHELGHHILGLSHAPAPTEHDLMGLGAYAEDPVIARLHLPNDHYATRPTGLGSINRIRAGFAKPTPVSDTVKGVKLFSPQSVEYNVLQLPVVDGFLYLENRTAEGYDRSIPFCTGHTGGLFAMEVSQYLNSVNVPGIATLMNAVTYDMPDQVFCDYYSFKGHNDTFTLGRYTISNVSPPGPVVTLDITRNDVVSTIAKYKFRYWVNNPAKAGYRMWHFVTTEANKATDIDFATFPSGTDPKGYFTITLEAYYNTGEVRSVNADATWTSTSPYVVIDPIPLQVNPGAQRKDTIIHLMLNATATRTPTAVVNVTHQTFSTSFRLLNVP